MKGTCLGKVAWKGEIKKKDDISRLQMIFVRVRAQNCLMLSNSRENF